MKTIVTLVSVADLGVLPSKIYGANGRALAHPRLDPARRRHVVEMDYDEYLKVGPHIAANATGPFTQWFAEFRVEDRPQDEQDWELEKLKNKQGELQKMVDDLTAENDKLSNVNLTLHLAGADPRT